MNNETKVLSWIQQWFGSNCDGDWEHDQKVMITNLDNPGWSLTVKLDETDLEGKEFNSFFIERSEGDWIACRIENNQFLGDGGVYNLVEILETFKSWAISNHSNNIPI